MKDKQDRREGIDATNKLFFTELDYSYAPSTEIPRFRVYTRRQIDEIPQLQKLPLSDRIAMKAIAAVFPFRVNNYVIDQLIDWSDIPNDPIYQLTFPQPDMLKIEDFQQMYTLVGNGASDKEIVSAAREIQQTLNPHPAGQMELNVPQYDGQPIWGLQHKYPETVLFFPAAGQTCHAYCTYCFRWAQFVGINELKFAAHEAEALTGYLREHKEVTDVLFTGGDPMVMKTKVLRRYIQKILDDSNLEHIQNIRIGTKAPAYWPYRFVDNKDADDLLRLFELVRMSGRQVAVMAHYSHPRELSTDVAKEALRRIRHTGATIRCQAPLIRHVNDDADVWAKMWQEQISLGAVPYYMFVERDTGARNYFEVPLIQALDIFNGAYRQISGLARTVRGPSMSATPGKVLVDGVKSIHGEKVFVLKFLQAREPQWVGKTFFAHYNPEAAWLDQLEPAFAKEEFFFEAELREMKAQAGNVPTKELVPELGED